MMRQTEQNKLLLGGKEGGRGGGEERGRKGRTYSAGRPQQVADEKKGGEGEGIDFGRRADGRTLHIQIEFLVCKTRRMQTNRETA